jgi:hypothetical protein
MTHCEEIQYGPWGRCARLVGGSTEALVTLDVGPRVIRYGLVGAANLFGEFPAALGADREWVNYGGHRLWHSPEIFPRTYAPDNAPVQSDCRDGRLIVTQALESSTGILKQMEFEMAEDGTTTVRHRLTNRNLWAVTLAPWALSVMAPGGTAVAPQEPYRPQPEALLPARPLVLWPYTDMADPRFAWRRDGILLRQDATRKEPQKFGIMNHCGWSAYFLDRLLFVKRFSAQGSTLDYPDFGCNNEIFTNADILEIESLGPLQTLEPEASAEHVETWRAIRLDAPPASDDERVALAFAHSRTA